MLGREHSKPLAAEPTGYDRAMSVSPKHPISFALDERVARVTINRPHKRNAMDAATWRALAAIAGSLSARGARALQISGAGEDFSAGADLAELRALLSRPSEQLANAQLVQQVTKLLESQALPSVALIRGACVDSGLGLALCCDMRLAAPDARFALTSVRLGLHSSLADTRRLASVIGLARAREMLLTARTIDAETALAWGLVNRVVEPSDDLQAAGDELTCDWARAMPSGLAATRRVMAALDGSRPLSEEILDRQFLEAFSSDDFRAGAKALLQQSERDPADGCKES